MNWSWKSILYWIMLIGSLVGGIVLIGYSLIEWSVQGASLNSELGSKNRELLYCGASLLLLFLVYLRDREDYPLPTLTILKNWRAVCVRVFLATTLGFIYIIAWQFSKPIFQETSIEWLRLWGHRSLMLLLSLIVLAVCIRISEIKMFGGSCE